MSSPTSSRSRFNSSLPLGVFNQLMNLPSKMCALLQGA